MKTLQPTLFEESLLPLRQPTAGVGESIQERFERFHAANPQVYRALRYMALAMRNNGVRHFGMKALFELLRYDYAMQTKGEDYKLCNDYTSRYARLLMDSEPRLDGFFELRKLRERGAEGHD